MSRQLRDYEYALPPELIARFPLQRREDSRMMILDRVRGTIAHAAFRDLPSLLRPDDLLVLNDTRVVPARVWTDDGRVELLCLQRPDDRTWVCMVKPGRRCREGAVLTVAGVRGVVARVLENGSRVIVFESCVDLERHGTLPLPPYLGREQGEVDRERYQTVYAAVSGAVAAPTAGLHFTAEMLSRLPHVFVTLHVGVGTFRPVKVENIVDHAMHSEQFLLSPEAVSAIGRAGRVVAVGTTSVRVLETCHRHHGRLVPMEGETDIFIYPPFDFRVTGALLTNFHLPKSTLLMLVSAFGGMELVREAYAMAVRERYRFYSYGDCMLIL